MAYVKLADLKVGDRVKSRPTVNSTPFSGKVVAIGLEGNPNMILLSGNRITYIHQIMLSD